MPTAAGGLIIDPAGESVTINLTQTAGLSITAYSDAALTSSVTLPVTTSTSQALYVANPDAYTLSIKLDGIEMAGGLGSTKQIHLHDGGVTTFNPVLTLRSSQNQFAPGDHGYLAWSCPVEYASGTYTMTPAGTVHLTRLSLPNTVNVTNIVTYVTTAGATLTSGQCFAALYSAAGAKLDTTADQSGTWNSTGVKTMALAGGAASRSAGDYYVAVWYNGTTGPTFPKAANATVAGLTNIGYATKLKAATADTSITTSGPATLGTQTGIAHQIWVALS